MKKIILLHFLLSFGNIYSQWIYEDTNIFGLSTTIFFTDSLNGYLGGYSYSSIDDYILKTTDGGQNWTKNSIVGNPTSIFFINSDTGFCSTSYKHFIYRTTDRGVNWEVIYSDSLPISDIYFQNDSTGWAVGGELWSEGLILKTTDFGNHWERRTLPIMNGLKAIKMLNDSIGYIVGGHPSKIWRTKNRGCDWDLILNESSQSHSFQYLNDISFLNDTIGFAVGSKFLKTLDGGANWEELSFPLLIYYSVFSYKNKSWITASGFNYSYILYTSDNGTNWIPINLSDGIHLSHSYFINDSLGWFCGIGNNVLKTFSGGLTVIKNPSTPVLLRPSQSQINIDIPIELEWSAQNYVFFQIQICNDSLFQKSIVDSVIIENKILIDSSCLKPYTTYYWKVRSKNIVEISDWSNINKFTTGLVLGISDKVILTNFNLTQNYPNPFNPVTTIQYEIPSLEHVSIKIYDMLGRQVAILVDEQKPAGSYHIEFDAHSLPSGVYFYRLQAGSFVETKKLVLLK
ncbi:MAG: YCF48-related protein [Ignavibacteriaceae bacterium]|nr:YCF48-related protein [Ignavibacteriaceae bacterium]